MLSIYMTNVNCRNGECGLATCKLRGSHVYIISCYSLQFIQRFPCQVEEHSINYTIGGYRLDLYTTPSTMDFLPLQALPVPPRQSSSTNPHSRHFHQFRHPLFIRHPAPITHVHFCPTRPHRYAVSSSTRVLIYAPKTGKVVKTISRFKATARSAEFRKDGKLVVAGSDDGTVQVFDVGSRAILRTFTGHEQ
jgi:WD40 repeat protein